MRTHLLFGVNVLHAVFKLQHTIDKSNLFLKFLSYSESLRTYRERRDQTIESWKILNQTVIVKSGRSRLLDVDVFVCRRFQLQALLLDNIWCVE